MKHCPHCGADISAFMAVATGSPASPFSQPQPTVSKYDQTATWKKLVELARERVAAKNPPTFLELIEPVIQRTGGVWEEGLSSIVHLVFDRPIVPRGGVLYQSTMLEGRSTYSPEQLKAMGYLVIDGKVIDDDGVPVSPAWGALNYWGGEKQFKRWHMTKPIAVNASRNGNPFFMDEEMVAFGATWRDLTKVKEAFLDLFTTFTQGVRGDGQIAQPFALEVRFG